jgi:hypothetical protein
MQMVEGELRRIAHRYMRMERPGHTLQTSALVNEAYLKLVDQARELCRGQSREGVVDGNQILGGISQPKGAAQLRRNVWAPWWAARPRPRDVLNMACIGQTPDTLASASSSCLPECHCRVSTPCGSAQSTRMQCIMRAHTAKNALYPASLGVHPAAHPGFMYQSGRLQRMIGAFLGQRCARRCRSSKTTGRS